MGRYKDRFVHESWTNIKTVPHLMPAKNRCLNQHISDLNPKSLNVRKFRDCFGPDCPSVSDLGSGTCSSAGAGSAAIKPATIRTGR